MTEPLHTDRLTLRPWTEEDAEALYEYARDPAVGPIAGWPPHKSVGESLAIIRSVFSSPEVYAIVLKGTDRPIGCCGLTPAPDINPEYLGENEGEIGYWLGVPHWGNGYITEAVNAIIGRCFDVLGLSALWICHADYNGRSRRVAEKCGFTYHHTEKDRLSPLGDTRTYICHRLSAADYRRR